MSPPVFFASLDGTGRGDRVVLHGDEGHHAADVRRLRVGEQIGLTDGAGRLAAGHVAEARRATLTVVVDDVRQVDVPQPQLIVAQAMARGGRDEAAVEAMTEVGADEVIGWQARRCVAQWTERTPRRWRATVQAAAKQSRRAWWPVVTGPVTTAELADRCRQVSLAVVLHEKADNVLSSVTFPLVGEILVVIGPEGGIDDQETAELSDAGGHVVRLGDSVLRSSTAGVAALSVICAATRWR